MIFDDAHFHSSFYFHQLIFIKYFMTKQPVTPVQMFKQLMYTNFTEISCIEEVPKKENIVNQRLNILKEEIICMQRSKSEYINLVQMKNKLSCQLKEMLNYRESIDYDHKFKRIKFDHYHFPYTNHRILKQQLYQQRTQNMEKRKQIKDLQGQLKRNEQIANKIKIQKQNNLINRLKKSNNQNRDCEEDFWLKRIEKMKNRHLNKDQEWRRAKIKHDYNLLVERTSCVCIGLKVCSICSDHNLLPRTDFYSREAILSPRYDSIYRTKKYF